MLKELKSCSSAGKTTLLITLLVLCNYTFSQWIQTTGTPEGSGITGMIYMPLPYDWIFVSTGSVFGGQMGGVRRSIDGGATWVHLIDCYIARTIILGQNSWIFASIWNYPAQNEGVFRYSANGWEPLYIFPSTGNNIFSLLNPNDTLILAGTRTGILRSTNNGVTFNFSNSGIPANSWVFDLAADSNNIIAAATTNGLFISTNLGDSWFQSTGLPAGDTVTSVIFYRIQTDNGSADKLIAGTDDGKILTSSSNSGYAGLVVSALLGNNVKIETTFGDWVSIHEYIYIGASPKNPQQPGGGVYQSTNAGQTFTQINEGLPQNPVVSNIIGIPGTTSKELITGLFNNTNNGAAVYKRTIPIGIKPISSDIPNGFSLSQNYPNPFNPSTNVRFNISESGFVKLKIYDLLGQEVETVVSEMLKPGTYEVKIDGSKFTSGIYFYRLVIDASTSFSTGFSETKKMMLVK